MHNHSPGFPTFLVASESLHNYTTKLWEHLQPLFFPFALVRSIKSDSLRSLIMISFTANANMFTWFSQGRAPNSPLCCQADKCSCFTSLGMWNPSKAQVRPIQMQASPQPPFQQLYHEKGRKERKELQRKMGQVEKCYLIREWRTSGGYRPAIVNTWISAHLGYIFSQ